MEEITSEQSLLKENTQYQLTIVDYSRKSL